MSATRSKTPPKIRILGAGPAGVAAAYALTKKGGANVEILERAPVAGGNSASFLLDNIWCDYGSHRFHPVAEPAVLADVQEVLGDNLLLRPRHGRIRLGGRWIHFPLKPLDAILRLPKLFAARLMADSLLKPFRQKSSAPRTFKTVLYDGLGPTIAENFYFPYVRKLWGLEPEQLAVKLAERRISSGSVAKILLKMLKMLPGLGDEMTGKFYYPRKGYGQITQALHDQAVAHGAKFHLGCEITAIERQENRVVAIRTMRDGKEQREATDQILSTIPLTILTRLMDPPPPTHVKDAVEAIRFRGMILIYLILETDQFTEYDAHYFPELSIPISRMSEPKNYSATTDPRGLTVLCAELPCDPGETWWDMSDDELGAEFCRWLGELGLPVTCPVRRTETRRLAHAYPVYDVDYEHHFNTVDDWLLGLDGLLVFGRQGLFAHDNTHHAFAMAYGAVDCLGKDGKIDAQRWAAYREEFSHHTVED